MQFILCLGGSVVVFLCAASASRAYVSSSAPGLLLASLALYCVGNLMMVRLMRHAGMSLAVSASSILQFLAINVIAFFFFGERLNPTQIAGLGLGTLAICLLLYPSQA